MSSIVSPSAMITVYGATVIAGELEGSWRARGQQEGLQYNGEAAG